MSQSSPFTLSEKEASKIVSNNINRSSHTDNLNDSGIFHGVAEDELEKSHCYLLQLKFTPVYGDIKIPQNAYKKLPRLINGIPLGAGTMTQGQKQNIFWRYVEGSDSTQTFMSLPMTSEEAEQSRRRLRDCLVTMAKVVFGDVTVKASIMLSQCVHFEQGLFLNDIAQNFDEGLHFSD